MAETLKTYQVTIYITMFVGYACYAYSRKAVSFALPKLMEEGMDKSEAGLITSSQYMAYAISKFLGGVLSDQISSKLLFSCGLFISGLSALMYASSDTVVAFTSLMFLNGLAQGCGWPACAKVLRHWFSPSQFGTLWSLLSASANISGGVCPFVSAYLILNYGWRVSLIVAGLTSLAVGFVSVYAIVDSPEQVGLKSFAGDDKKKSGVGSSNLEATFIDLLRSPFLWLVSVSYMIVFCAKTSAVDWGQLYIMEDRGHSQYVGSAFTSSVETGGFFGGILGGYITDRVLRHSGNKKVAGPRRGNPRWPVAIGFMVGVMCCFHLVYFFITEASSKLWITSLAFVLGACLYGPIAIFGVVATESAPAHISGSAHAIVALAANVGAITSGLPFSFIAKRYSWSTIFLLLELLTGAMSVAMLVLRNLNSEIGRSKRE